MARMEVTERLAKHSRDDGDCRVWTGCSCGGYGRIRVAGKSLLAHRVAYEEANGPIAAGVEVCHRCDNPACINLGHLFLGTHADNMRDMAVKGRRSGKHCGEEHAKAKLDAEKVGLIRSGGSLSAFAREFGVSVAAVWAARHGKSWKAVAHG